MAIPLPSSGNGGQQRDLKDLRPATVAAADAPSSSLPTPPGLASAAPGVTSGGSSVIKLRLMFDLAGKLDPFSARIQVGKGN